MSILLKYLKEIIFSVLKCEFRIYSRYCSSCSAKRLFLISGKEGRSVRCLGCKYTLISLSMLESVKELQLDFNSATVYELSFHGPTFEFLRDNYKHFYFSEFFSSTDLGTVINGVRNEDVQRLTFESSKFDLVSCTEVFEHVENYKDGFSEIRRVLKPGGVFLLTVPLFDAIETEQTCKVGKDGNLIWLSEQEFHDSRVSGVNSVPVFWKHSRHQLLKDLEQAGFSSVQLLKKSDFSPMVTQVVVSARVSFEN